MNAPTKVFLTLFLIFGQNCLLGQQLKKFTYGGSGDKFKGTFSISYFIESDDRRHRLDELPDVIDLNEYSEPVKFLIQISDLKLGLNGTYNQVKNSDHPRVFYLELSKVDTNYPEVVFPVGADSVRISAPQGHYGPKINQLTYRLKDVKIKSTLLFRVRSRTIDGIYDREWDGLLLSKSITVNPKMVKIDSTITTAQPIVAEKEYDRTVRPRKRREVQEPAMYEKDTLAETKTIEDKLWEKIEEDLISNNKSSLLERCQVYRMNCNQQIFTECKYSEDVLFFMATLAAGQEKLALIKEYSATYPSGKYRDRIEKLIVKPKETLIPIKADLAQLDFDRTAVLINRIKGGNRPYYAGFHDYGKNKNYAVKSIRFNKEDLYIDLETIEIPEGNYTVKVVDSKGQVFFEQPGIYVSKTMQIPKSLKLSGILIFVGVLGFLYRKYVHF